MENKQFKEWVLKYDLVWYSDFDSMPFAFQWGVYLEFFDSVGIEIFIHKVCIGSDDWGFCFLIRDDLKEINIYKSLSMGFGTYSGVWYERQEAQQEAIKKAFELLPT